MSDLTYRKEPCAPKYQNVGDHPIASQIAYSAIAAQQNENDRFREIYDVDLVITRMISCTRFDVDLGSLSVEQRL